MICRSLVCCRLELHQNRTATTLKLKAEFDRRVAQKLNPAVVHGRPYVKGEPPYLRGAWTRMPQQSMC